jgi:lysophospholipase L1-like esterase
VSLGDSLASGYQPTVRADTRRSYTDRLYGTLKRHDPHLRHVKLGCRGETTTSLMQGGQCSYSGYAGATSQLVAAERFLRAHRSAVRYVTIDIGANDVNSCATSGSFNTDCALAGASAAAGAAPRIAQRLRAAGGPTPVYAAMTYYDPFLATWLTGADGQQTARLSAQVLPPLNRSLAAGFQQEGFRIARVAEAFRTEDFEHQVRLPGVGTVPVNVARICQWTWECTRYRDIHANPQGHRVIARAFEQALGSG